MRQLSTLLWFCFLLVNTTAPLLANTQSAVVRNHAHHRLHRPSTTQKTRQETPVHYYTNSAGNQVQSPTIYQAPPQGATAQCGDGSYSFSQSRRGTCSRHGGVKQWL